MADAMANLVANNVAAQTAMAEAMSNQQVTTGSRVARGHDVASLGDRIRPLVEGMPSCHRAGVLVSAATPLPLPLCQQHA